MKTEAETESQTLPTLDGSVSSKDAPKVTISVRVRPIVKVRLTTEAAARSVTLSDLVESIIQTGNQIEELEALKKKIAFYECEPLLKLFEAENGETVEYRDSKGHKIQLKITNVQDVFTVLIHSFKTDKK